MSREGGGNMGNEDGHASDCFRYVPFFIYIFY